MKEKRKMFVKNSSDPIQANQISTRYIRFNLISHEKKNSQEKLSTIN